MITFFRVIKAGLINFIRNGWLSLASISIMVLTLFTVAVFLVLNIVLNAGITEVQDKMDISVYFNEDVKEKKILEIQEELSLLTEVKAINYVSKEEALEKMKKTFANNEKILEPLEEENPLPASLGVKVYEVEDFDTVAAVLEKEEYKKNIHNVSYKNNEKIIKRLYVATNFIKKAGWISAAVFTVTSLIIIFNTLRMAIFARKEEIEVMKLVGATKRFIEGPFIVEGMIIGLFSAIISSSFIIPGIKYASPRIDLYLGTGLSGSITGYVNENLVIVVLTQIGIGILIGVVSSYFAIRRYLRRA